MFPLEEWNMNFIEIKGNKISYNPNIEALGKMSGSPATCGSEAIENKPYCCYIGKKVDLSTHNDLAQTGGKGSGEDRGMCTCSNPDSKLYAKWSIISCVSKNECNIVDKKNKNITTVYYDVEKSKNFEYAVRRTGYPLYKCQCKKYYITELKINSKTNVVECAPSKEDRKRYNQEAIKEWLNQKRK